MMATNLERAQLVPVDKDTKRALMAQAIGVHFNPDTLKITRTVTVQADTGSKNSSTQAAQQPSSSSAKLAVDLVFDTTDIFEAQQDAADVVKSVTSKIVAAFVAPTPPDNAAPGTPIPANPCLFLWGTFQFIGLVDSYNETLEFFSASGVPLRAAVSLSLTENRYKVSNVPQRKPGQAQALPAASHIAPALAAAGLGAGDWRGTALANGLETPRFAVSGSVSVISGASFAAAAATSAQLGLGFTVGASASVGTSIAGAFSAGAGVG